MIQQIGRFNFANDSQISNINTNYIDYSRPKATSFKQGLETDVVEIKNKKSHKKRNIFFGIGAVALATIGAVYGIKKHQVKDIKNIQKTFQETFMRDNISIEETKTILSRYKEIEKIADDEEYLQALFKEVKNNYGFKDTDIKLVKNTKKGAAGCMRTDNKMLFINPKTSRSDYLNVLHHEFRHAKQHELIARTNPIKATANIISYLYKNSKKEYEELMDSISSNTPNISIGLDTPLEEAISILSKTPEIQKNLLSRFSTMTPVPEKYKEFANKLVDAQKNYISLNKDFPAYFNNFMEIDARKAGNSMEKHIRGAVITSRTFNDFLVKITPNSWLRTIYGNKS